jgi:H/ACA ribonucleoprotein complex non-core subunit NAF1
MTEEQSCADDRLKDVNDGKVEDILMSETVEVPETNDIQVGDETETGKMLEKPMTGEANLQHANHNKIRDQLSEKLTVINETSTHEQMVEGPKTQQNIIEELKDEEQVTQEPTRSKDHAEILKQATAEDDFLGNILKEAETKSNKIQIGEADDNAEESISSGNDSSSDSDESEDEDEHENKQEDLDDNEGQEDNISDEPIKSKNEITDEPAEELPEDFKIQGDEPIQHIGEIVGFVDKSIIIKSNTSGEFRFLMEGSVLCFEDRTPIGYLFEIFGPVSKPMYRVKFNGEEDLDRFKKRNMEKVFYVVPKSHFEYTDAIKAMKGTDASNWNDEELPEEEQDFSDDEKEMESKKAKKKKRSKKENDDEGEKTESAPPKKKQNNWQPRSRLQQQPYQTSQNGQRQQQHIPAQSSSILGYRPRSERDQSQMRAQPMSIPGFPIPGNFNPPPQMVCPMPQFPGDPQMPMVPQNQQLNPLQWQQFQQFLQMQQMMQQFMQKPNGNQPRRQ